jgi:hypothetical protein
VTEIAIGKEWDRLMGEALGEWTRLSRQGLSDDDILGQLQAHLEGLSEKPEQDIARTSSSVSYNQGRSVEIKNAADMGQVAMVVRSELLDDNTCEQCARLDGATFEVNSDEYQMYMPPAFCEGGDRCRGFYVPITGGIA